MTEATNGTVGSLQPPIGKVGYNYGFSKGERTSGDSTVDTSQDKDMFLKLLVAQMRYQDPTKPTDTTAFLAQTAQFTLVEKMSEMQESQDRMAEASGLQAAIGLVGRTIEWSGQDSAGNAVTKSGTVTGFTLKEGVPTLLVGTTEVTLTDITKVTATAAAASAASATGTTTTGGTTTGGTTTGGGTTATGTSGSSGSTGTTGTTGGSTGTSAPAGTTGTTGATGSTGTTGSVSGSAVTESAAVAAAASPFASIGRFNTASTNGSAGTGSI